MSVRVIADVWENSRAKGSGLLLLLAIADFANDDGVAYPAVATLAKKIRMGVRNTQNQLRRLEEMGELQITPGGADHRTNVYRVGAKIAPLQSENCTGGVQQLLHPRGATATAPDPSLNRHMNREEEQQQQPLASLSPAQRDVFGEIDLSMGRYMRELDIFSELLLFVQDYAPDEARECLRTVRARGEKAFPQNLRRVALAEIGGPLWQRERDKERRAAFNQGGPYLCPGCGFAGSLPEVRAHKVEAHTEGGA